MAISTKKKNSLKSKTRKHYNSRKHLTKSRKNGLRTCKMRGGSESVTQPKVVVSDLQPKSVSRNWRNWRNWFKGEKSKPNAEIRVSPKENLMMKRLGGTIPPINQSSGKKITFANEVFGSGPNILTTNEPNPGGYGTARQFATNEKSLINRIEVDY